MKIPLMGILTGMMGGGQPSTVYADKIIDTFGANVVFHLPLWEPTGVTAQDYSANNRDGVYRNTAGVLNGVTLGATGIGDGRTGVTLDGTNGYIDLYSAALAAAFNGAEGTLLIWIKRPEWVENDFLIQLRVDGNNKIIIEPGAARINFRYFAGAGLNNLTATVLDVTETAWMPLAFTWSKSSDRIIPYIKGVQVQAATTGLGNWTGALSSTRCNIGVDAQTPTSQYAGGVAHVTLLDREATPAEILAVSIPSGAAPWTTSSWTIPQGAANTPAVMMTFDDEYESVYTEAFKNIMEPQGARGTFYVMTDAIDGANDPPFVTTEELLEMDAAGWSIGNHTTNQTQLADVDIPTATAVIAGAKTALDGMGLTKASMHLAYPGGSWDADVTTASIAAGMLTGRRVSDSTPDFPTYNPDDNYQILSSMRLGDSDTVLEAIAIIDTAIAQGKTALFYGHKIETPADDGTKWEPWMLWALVHYCGARNIPFLTINDYYALQSGPVTISRA